MNEDLELSQLSRAIARRWAIVLACTAVAALLGYVLSQRLDKLYEASATVLAAQEPPGVDVAETDRATKEQLALTFADLARRPSVLEPAAEALGVEGDWKALRSHVVVRLVPRTLLLEITAQAGSPSEAERIADEVSRQLVAFTAGLSPFRQVQVESARADLAPVSPNVRMNTLLAGAVGFLVGSAVAVVAERNRRRSRETFASAGSLEQLGEIDLREEMAATTTPIGGPDGVTPAVDQAALIVAGLRVVRRHSPLRTVAIVGPASLTVRARVTAYLAIGLSQDGSKTVLVDLDLQRPTQHRLCGVDGEQGVAELLASRGARKKPTLKQTRLPALRVLPAGGPPINSKQLLSPAGLDRIVQDLLKTAEVVVFDLPIGDRVAEVVVLGELVDAVVLVVPRRRLRRTDRRLVEDLARAGVELAGIVTVRSPLLTRFGSDEIPRRPIVESVVGDHAAPDNADGVKPGLDPSTEEKAVAAPQRSSGRHEADR